MGGHSVEVLMRVYAKCITGLDYAWIARTNQALHLEGAVDASDALGMNLHERPRRGRIKTQENDSRARLGGDPIPLPEPKTR